MKLFSLSVLLDNIYKSKNKIIAALLILAMTVTSIAIPSSTAKAEEDTLTIAFDCSSFNVQDKDGNILFEKINSNVTQLDTNRVEYTQLYPVIEVDGNLHINTEELRITDVTYLIITCNVDGNFNICISGEWCGNMWTIAGTKIIISEGKVTKSPPTTKIHWKKVKKAQRYVIYKVINYGRHQKRLYKLNVTKKTSYTVVDENGKTYLIKAQRKAKGKWKTLKTFDITI